MKKNILFFATLLTIGVLCAGCGKEEEEVIPTTHEKISVSINTSVKSPMAMTREELKNLSAPQVKEMVEAYLPNWRAIYGIPADHEMTDEDYLALRDQIYEQLYGKDEVVVASEGAADIDFSHPDQIVGEDGSYLDPGWIYYAPCKEYIDTLTDKNFIEYLGDLMEYWGKDLGDTDLSTLSPSDLNQMRIKVVDQFCQPWGTTYIPTVDELAAQGKDTYMSEDGDTETAEPTEGVEEGAEEGGTEETGAEPTEAPTE